MQETDVQFDRRFFLLVLVPTLTYTLFDFVIRNQSTEVGFELVSTVGTSAAEVKHRFYWIAAFAGSFAVSVSVAAAAGLSAWRNLLPRDRGVAIAILALGLVVVAIGEFIASGQRWYVHMGKDLYAQAFGQESAGLGLLRMLDNGLNAVKFAGGFALILLTLALIATLRSPGGSADHQAAALSRAARQQRELLYLGVAVYVMACLTMIAWMSWPLPLLSDTSQEEYRHMRLGATVLQGVGFSLGIAAIYVPSALSLRQRALTTAEAQTSSSEEFRAWLQDKGFEITPLDQLRQIGAILMPTAVGFMPALGNLWFG